MRKGEFSVFSNNLTFGMLRESNKSHLDDDADKDKDEEKGRKNPKKKKKK